MFFLTKPCKNNDFKLNENQIERVKLLGNNEIFHR